MKALLLILLLACAKDATAQRFIPSDVLGAGRGVGSRIFPWGQNEYVMLGDNPNSRQPLILRGSPSSRFTSPSANLSMPDVQLSSQAIAFNGNRGWCGTLNKLLTTNSLVSWQTLDLSELEREVSAMSISPLTENEALVSAASYIVTRIDSSGGSVGKWTEDYRGVVYHVVGDAVRRLAMLPHESSPISNPQRLTNGSICVALRIAPGVRTFLAIIDLSGQVRYVDAPSGMPLGVTPTALVRTVDAKVYAFYAGISGGGDASPSFVIYDEKTGMASWHPLDQNQAVVSATSAGPSRVIAHSFSRLLTVVGTTVTERSLLHPTLQYPMGPIGVALFNGDSVAVSLQEGLMLLPLPANTTSVINETRPGRIVRAPSSTISFEHIVDGSENVSWLLYDANGRLVEQGLTEPGQTDITVELLGKPQGIYLLHLKAGNRHLILERLIYMD